MRHYFIMSSMLLIILLTIPFAKPDRDFNQKGLAAFNNGDYATAFTQMTYALEASPSDETLRKNYVIATRAWASALYRNNMLDSAISILKEASVKIMNSPEISKDLLTLTVNKGYNALRNHDLATARQALSDVQQLNRRHVETLKLAGEVAYTQHDLKNALTHWQQALALNPADTHLKRKISRLQKELGSEQRFSRSSAYQFDIRFDHEALGGKVYDIRSFLMEAYWLVGNQLGHYPDYPISVLLYKDADFRDVNNVSDYTLGLYDGKIRVPLKFTRLPLEKLKGVLIHEYTHAVIYHLAGTACPIWLNEGIAMREMNSSFPVFTAPLRKALRYGTTLSFDQLTAPSTWKNIRTFPLAYAQSWVIAEYLFYRWSNHQIVDLLKELKTGKTFEQILVRDMNRTLGQFEQEWIAFARGRVP